MPTERMTTTRTMTKEGREVAQVNIYRVPRHKPGESVALPAGEHVWVAAFTVLDPGNVGEGWTAEADTPELAAAALKSALAADAYRIAGYLGVVDAYERGETDV